MRNSTYHYNPKTCQYERTSVRIGNVMLYIVGLILTSVALFAALVLTYDHFTITPLEAKLNKENWIYSNHKVILTHQLSEVEASMNELRVRDADLQTKIFGDTPSAPEPSVLDNQNIIQATASDANDVLDSLKTRLEKIYLRAEGRNTVYADKIEFEKDHLSVLESTPTLQPIANPNLNLSISGFGIRINPFHKAKYEHTGLDFAAPNGTEVVATASGIVADIDRSELQAGPGNFIEISHSNGYTTRYAHLDKIMVRAGQRVTKGSLIGTVGTSGGSVAPHLHYEVLHNGKQVDPIGYMIEGLTSDEYARLADLSKKLNQSLD